MVFLNFLIEVVWLIYAQFRHKNAYHSHFFCQHQRDAKKRMGSQHGYKIPGIFFTVFQYHQKNATLLTNKKNIAPLASEMFRVGQAEPRNWQATATKEKERRTHQKETF